MIGSLYSGISGLKANTSAMAVIGDNIANVDTTGFKVSRVSFANIFTASMGASRNQIGRGVVMNGVNPNWDSGSMENTTSVTDLSINGQGMFRVQDPADGGVYYTRAGNFDFDRDGNLVTPDGLIVQGYPIDINGNRLPIDNISLPNGTNSPRATDEVTFELNLDATAADGDTFDSTITVYDSLGTPVELTFQFTYDQTNTRWDWTVSPSTGACATTGSISFDTDGSLDAATEGAGVPTVAVTGLPGDDLAVDWTYLDAGVSDGSVTGYASDSAKTAQTQTGYPPGMLQGVSVDEDGVFTGLYSNGSMIPFAQIALADFPSYAGLSKQGSNLYAESLASGQALVSTANTSGLGSVAPNTLEMSNVDMATEFVELITT
ncbi:MAG: flagellar hook protein FlgE, partial [Desulfosarcinaceae bacterium]